MPSKHKMESSPSFWMIIDIFSSFDPAIYSYFSLRTLLFFSLALAPLASCQKYSLSISPLPWALFSATIVISEQASRTLGAKILGFPKIISPLFLRLILINFIGLIPYTFSLSRHLIITLSLGLPLWISLVMSSFSYNTQYAAAGLLPGGAPNWLNPFLVLIETTRILARPITLSFRLAANITAGHVVLGLLGSYIIFSLVSNTLSLPSAVILITQVGYIIFELGIGLIQAYIFCLLLTLYSDEHSLYMWPPLSFGLRRGLLLPHVMNYHYKYLTRPLSPAIVLLGAASLFLFSLSTWLFLADKTILLNWEVVSLFSAALTLPLILDPWGTLFASVVCFISGNIIIFSISYMADEKNLNRFTHLVLIFVASMLFLIFIPHIMALLLGWDGLGLVSFILVIFYQNHKSLAAGIITALTNRIGDVLILLRIAWMASQGHWLVLNMFSNTLVDNSLLILIIMLAAITKSAQIPFSRWLPAAIAAPTPVSALVHSSTLVTAGIFLMFRFYPFLKSLSLFNTLLLIIGRTTILMAGTAATLEGDIKKIIALSTLRQLGVIVTRLALGFTTLTFFHLVTHALFKALLFVCAGHIIHLHHHSQDLRFMGNTHTQTPLLNSCIVISNMALCGSPFLAGFYSKDMIIESSLFLSFNNLITSIFLLATGLTAAYRARFLITVTLSPNLSLPLSPTTDKDRFIHAPTLNLSLGAITVGALVSWVAIAPLTDPTLTPGNKIFALIMTILGAFLPALVSSPNFDATKPLTIAFSTPHFFITRIWSLTPRSSQLSLPKPYWLSKRSLKTIDQGWLEYVGPQGTWLLLTHLIKTKPKSQSLSITRQLFVTFYFALICYISPHPIINLSTWFAWP